jgi:hypothetical protein
MKRVAGIVLIAFVLCVGPAIAQTERTIEGAHEFLRLTLGDQTASTQSLRYGRNGYYLAASGPKIVQRVNTSGCRTTLVVDDEDGASYREIDWSRVTSISPGAGVVTIRGPIVSSYGSGGVSDTSLWVFHQDVSRIQQAMDFIRARCDPRGATGF